MREKLVSRFNNFYFLFGLLVIILVIYQVCTNYTDSDMWFILSNGKEIVKNGIPLENPFTYIDGLSIVLQQWLWSVITWVVYSSVGSVGVVVLLMVLFVIAVWLLCAIAKVNKCDTNVAFLVSVLLFSFMGWYFINIRPTMITVILVLAEVLVLDKYTQTCNSKHLYWLILISLLEVNLHSSLWILHFVLLVPYVFPCIKNPFIKFKDNEYSIKPILLISIPMFVVGFLNPYGLDGMLYLVNSYGSALNSLNINELQQPSILSPVGIVMLLQLLLILFMFKKDCKYSSSKVYIFCGLFILGSMHIRNYVYFMVGFLLMFFHLLEGVKTDINVKGTRLVRFVIPFLLGFTLFSQLSNLKDIEYVKDSIETPIKAVEYIKENNLSDRNIYTDFNQGGFFAYSGIKIFIDARPELYLDKINGKDDILNDYIKVLYGVYDDTFNEVLEKYNFDYICSIKGTRFDAFLDRQGYNVVVDSNSYRLFKVVV